MLASIGGIVAVPLIVGAHPACLTQIVSLINAALLASGIVTVAQCLGFGPIGYIRLPVVMGVYCRLVFFFVLSISIAPKAVSRDHGLSADRLIYSNCASFYSGQGSETVLGNRGVSGVVVTSNRLTILPVANLGRRFCQHGTPASHATKAVSSTDLFGDIVRLAYRFTVLLVLPLRPSWLV